MDLSSNVTVNNSKLGLKIVRKVKERGMKYGEKNKKNIWFNERA